MSKESPFSALSLNRAINLSMLLCTSGDIWNGEKFGRQIPSCNKQIKNIKLLDCVTEHHMDSFMNLSSPYDLFTLCLYYHA